MERFIGVVVLLLVAALVLGFALAHLGLAVLILLAAGLVGRHLRQRGV